ncbi:RHS repeat-associated core domain-containing protein [Phaeodactylibacter luteus]|uniref:RHS repeat-associated core domain-containing protein n=1 Tax=Phaeodactylibacter luteus TaxID=1564516 RepID=A0A5C6RGB4_9BACT|nr:RHS repeat-associated core domain-containing protein [Phaeodactylibacter luteus]TXB58404.1 RHS repeat-associated core domain-containing protein [Phaeodactylibacter luteus]
MQRLWYYPFGLQLQGIGRDEPAPAHLYRYNGKAWDPASGLSDYGARWYDAGSGRWSGVDPLAAEYAGWSPYNYVMGNPIINIDPDGRSVENTIFVDSDGNELYRSEDNLDDAVVVVNDIGGFKANLGLTGGKTDGHIQSLRGYGESYYTDQLGNLWDMGEATKYGGGEGGYEGYRLLGEGWSPEMSVRLAPDGEGGMVADWGWLKDHEDPTTNINAILDDQTLVHTHPVNKGLEQKEKIGWSKVKFPSGHGDGGPPSDWDYGQIPSLGMKGRFNVAVSRDNYHFYNENSTFSVPRNFFRY